MRVLHVTNAYPTAATPEYGVFIREQIRSLRASEDTHHVIFINGRHEGKGAYLRAARQVWRHASRYDVVHCHHLFSLLVCIPSVLKCPPIVLSFLSDWTHEIEGSAPEWLRALVCWLGVLSARAVIFKSRPPRAVQHLAKVRHLPNGVDEAFFHPGDREDACRAVGIDPENSYVLFVSSKQLDRAQKRIDRFNAMMALAVDEAPSLRLTPLFLVGVRRDLVPDYFRASLVHVLTSDYEGSPNSVKEALSCGIPVLSTDVGNVREMLEGVPGCRVYSSFDAEQCAADVIALGVGATVARPDDVRSAFLRHGVTRANVARILRELYAGVIRRPGAKS